MTNMAVAVAALCMSCNLASAEVISGTQILFGPNNSLGANYEAGVIQSPSPLDSPIGNGTVIFFSYNGTSLGFADIALDEGTDWYLANAGDTFSASTIAANQFPIIYKVGTPPGPAVTIPLGNFYLGMNTDFFSRTGQHRDIFGWLELNNTGTELIPVANAVAYNEPGIIIGTSTPAPEPATALTLLVALPLLALRRHPKLRHSV